MPDGTGRAGEAAACSYVERELGFEIVETNFRTREGEIDIVARDSGTYVFIEVKTRTNRKFGEGRDQISLTKALRLQTTAQRFIENLESPGEIDWRIDVVSVEMGRSGVVKQIDHIPHAIEEA